MQHHLDGRIGNRREGRGAVLGEGGKGRTSIGPKNPHHRKEKLTLKKRVLYGELAGGGYRKT